MATTRAEGLGLQPAPKGANELMKPPGAAPSKSLFKLVNELASSSAFLIHLAEMSSDRMTLNQAAFFMLAATKEASGKPATRTELLRAAGVDFRPSIRNSYRQLLEPSRAYPNAVGWLTTEDNPEDDREQFLRLTDEGRAVVDGALLGLKPVLGRS